MSQEHEVLPPLYTWLKQERERRNLSQEDMAKHLENMERKAYAAWENGTSLPRMKSRAAISTYFGVHVVEKARLITKADEELRVAGGENTHIPPTLPTHPIAPFPSPFPHRQKTRLSQVQRSFFVTALLLFVLSSLLVLALSTTLTPPASQVVGRFAFLSSDLVEENAANGIADRAQIDLQNVPAPQAGKHYYAWMRIEELGSSGILLGALPVRNGEIHFTYPGDMAHTNLLNTATDLLITEQSIIPTPLGPSTDKRDWHYQASIPNDHPATTPFGLRDHVEHLLAVDRTLYKRGLYEGLMLWATRTMEKNFVWTMTARDQFEAEASATSIRTPLIKMLNSIDGVNTPHLDMPPQPVLLDGLDRRSAVFPLLPQGQQPLSETSTAFEESSYLSHIDLHLRGINALAGSNASLRDHSSQLINALASVRLTLTQARDTIKALLKMTDAQLHDQAALFLLDDLSRLMQDAYAGPQGMYWISTNVQRLAVMDIMKSS